MTKNIKFIAPLALVAFGTLASCGGKASDSFAHLNRVQYDEITGTDRTSVLTKASDILTNIEDSQGHKKKGAQEYDVGFSIPKNGMLKLNFAFALSGDIQFYQTGMMPIDANGINVTDKNTITVEWDLDSRYIKVTGKSDSSYILKDQSGLYYKYLDLGENDKYYYPVNSTETKIESENQWKARVVSEAAINHGINMSRSSSSIAPRPTIKGISACLGMSGFGTELDLNAMGSPTNYIAPGNWFRDPMFLAVDKALNTVKKGKSVLGSKDNDSLSVNLALTNLDLQTDVVELIKLIMGGEGEIELPFDLTGAGDIDYFVAWEKDFIKQHELILNLQNTQVVYVSEDEHLGSGRKSEDFFLNAKVDLSFYVGQEFTEDVCKPEKVDISKYSPIIPVIQ